MKGTFSLNILFSYLRNVVLQNLLFEFKKIISLKFVVVGFLLCVFFVPVGNATEIVVNQSVPVQAVSLNKIRAIFTMHQRFWPSGEQIKVFTLVDKHPLHKAFAKNKLHMFPHQLRRVWDRMVFSGTGQAPVTLESEQEMLDKVANTPYAIGYLSREPDNEKIRILVNE